MEKRLFIFAVMVLTLLAACGDSEDESGSNESDVAEAVD